MMFNFTFQSFKQNNRTTFFNKRYINGYNKLWIQSIKDYTP